MQKRIIKILNKPFIRNVTLLVTGTAAAQSIALLASPIITRLYGPEAFGVMGVFLSLVGIFAPIASLTYPIAIVLPKDDRNAKKIIKLSIYISLSLAFLVALILLFFYIPVVELFQLREVSSYLFLIPLVIIFSGLNQVLEHWLIRTKQFRINAKVAFLQSFIINFSKMGIGFFNPVATVLVVLSAFANGIRAFMSMYLIKKTEYKPIEYSEGNLYSVKEIAKKYKDFPLFRAPEVFIHSVSQRFPILMLTIFFGPLSAGFYTLGNTVLQKPIQLVGKSVGDVFYPRISKAANNREDLTNLIKKATLALVAIGIIPFGLIIFFGPWIFGFIFGAEWITAGKYAQWIGIFLFCEFINRPSVMALPVLSAQLFHLLFTGITMIVRITALMIGYYFFSSELVAIALFGVFSAILQIILFIMVLKRSGNFYN